MELATGQTAARRARRVRAFVESTRAKTDDERPGRRLHAGYDDARRLCETGECATCRSQVYGEKDIQVRRLLRPPETQLCIF